jgi:alkyl hydroperoxide reductase subunit F
VYKKYLIIKTMLDSALKEQLKTIFADLQANYVLDIAVSPQHESRTELVELLNDVAASSAQITCRIKDGEALEFSLLKNEIATGIKFRAIPNGHEFTSLLLAILNSDGKGKNIPDETICNRIKALKGNIHLTTYVSLTCTNCPNVVQTLNLMALLNDNFTHEMVDGALYQLEVEALKIQGVPSVFADGKLLHVGKADLGELLSKLEEHYGVDAGKSETSVKKYDVVVIGGGPAGSAAAIYSARLSCCGETAISNT